MNLLLNAAEIAELTRETAGQGGWQGLLERLCTKLNSGTGRITLTDDDIESIRRYAFHYGNGGFESRLRRIFERHLGPNLGV